MRTCIQRSHHQNHQGEAAHRHGRQRADQLANEARDPSKCDLAVSVGNAAFGDLFWPVLKGKTDVADRTTPNLVDAIKRHAGHLSRGFADAGMHEGFWQDVMPELHQASFGFWKSSSITQASITQVLKARYGQTWTMNQAVKMQRAYRPGLPVPTVAICPLCHGHDNIAHLLGECQHPVMKGLIIERHNVACRTILQFLKNGSQGACHFIADIGSPAKMATYDCPDTRIPHWLLGDQDLPEGTSQRTKLRPDILMVRPRDPAAPSSDDRRGMTIVEVGYCSDTRYLEKLKEKNEQHQLLKSLLLARGHTVTTCSLILGNAGVQVHREHAHCHGGKPVSCSAPARQAAPARHQVIAHNNQNEKAVGAQLRTGGALPRPPLNGGPQPCAPPLGRGRGCLTGLPRDCHAERRQFHFIHASAKTNPCGLHVREEATSICYGWHCLARHWSGFCGCARAVTCCPMLLAAGRGCLGRRGITHCVVRNMQMSDTH